jgi:hypothetical protein
MKNQFLKIKKKAEPRSRPVGPGSQPYTMPPPHPNPCPHHHWSGGGVATITIEEGARHRGVDVVVIVIMEESRPMAEMSKR